jgi:hypothetical protein
MVSNNGTSVAVYCFAISDLEKAFIPNKLPQNEAFETDLSTKCWKNSYK